MGPDEDESGDPDEPDFEDESTPRGKSPFADRGQAIFAWCRDFIEYISALAREEYWGREAGNAEPGDPDELADEDR